MKEIIKTTIKKYDATGKLVEHTETTVEKENVNYNLSQYFNYHNQNIPKWFVGDPYCESGKTGK